MSPNRANGAGRDKDAHDVRNDARLASCAHDGRDAVLVRTPGPKPPGSARRRAEEVFPVGAASGAQAKSLSASQDDGGKAGKGL